MRLVYNWPVRLPFVDKVEATQIKSNYFSSSVTQKRPAKMPLNLLGHFPISHLRGGDEEEEEEEEEEEFTESYMRGAPFPTMWDQHAVAQHRL